VVERDNRALTAEQLKNVPQSPWTKTEAGWLANTNTVGNYLNVATMNHLPLETLNALDFPFGLRQITSADFRIVLRLVPILAKQYYLESVLVGKSLVANLVYATKKILELQIMDINTGIVSEVIIQVWRIINEIKEKKRIQDTDKETKHMDILVSCRRDLYYFEKKICTQRPSHYRWRICDF